MRIGTPKEISDGEARVAMTPESAVALQKLGYECLIEAGAGLSAGFSDAAYEAAGVGIVKTPAALWKGADIITKVRPPNATEAKRLGEGKTLISFFYPAQNEAQMAKIAGQGATVIAMDMVPRISRAQKMDALSSMANIAGYRAVIEAAGVFGRFFGKYIAPGFCNQNIILDTDADSVPWLWDIFIDRDINTRFDGQHHAWFEGAPGVAYAIFSNVMHVDPEPMTGAVDKEFSIGRFLNKTVNTALEQFEILKA